MPAVKRDWERRMREIRTSGVTRGRGGAGRSFLLYRFVHLDVPRGAHRVTSGVTRG
jgi:hypothetical protein